MDFDIKTAHMWNKAGTFHERLLGLDCPEIFQGLIGEHEDGGATSMSYHAQWLTQVQCSSLGRRLHCFVTRHTDRPTDQGRFMPAGTGFDRADLI